MVDQTDARHEFAKRLGLRIADQRKALGWTQGQLAEQLSVDAETVSRFERGISIPALLTLDRLAGILNSSISDLLKETVVTPSDQVVQISAWLAGLSKNDHDFAVAQIKALCDHLRQRQLKGSVRNKSRAQ